MQPRHSVDIDGLKRFYTMQTARFGDLLETTRLAADNLSLVAQEAERLGYSAIVLCRDDEGIDYLSTASVSYASMYTISTKPNAKLEIHYKDQKPFALSGPVDRSLTGGGDWLSAFALCVLSGSDQSLIQLCSVPIDLLKRSSTKTVKPVYSLIEAFQELSHNNSEVALANFEQAKRTLAKLKDDWSLLIGCQIANLGVSLISDPTSLDITVRDSLDAHKKYWSKTSSRRLDWSGYIAGYICTIIRYAALRGVEVDIESEYIPSFITRFEK